MAQILQLLWQTANFKYKHNTTISVNIKSATDQGVYMKDFVIFTM